MLTINKHFFKRRPRREYLDDKYKPGKTPLVVWLQRFVMTILLIALALFLLLLSNQVFANTNSSQLPLVNKNNISQGSLITKSNMQNTYYQIPLLHTEVDIDVSGMIARSHIKQVFKNPGENWIEAIYVFPLPENAAVDHMRMRIGQRVIEGEIKEKQVAKKLYQKARTEGKKASLVEQDRPNLFTNSVANIGPGETIIIEIEYQQTLYFDKGSFSLRFPLAITPRYNPAHNPGGNHGKNPGYNSRLSIEENLSLTHSGWAKNTPHATDTSRTNPLTINSNKTNNHVSINIELNTGFELQNITSRYHNIIKHQSNNIFNISLAEGNTPTDRDFELVWSPVPDLTPKAAVFKEYSNGEHFQMVMLVPPGGEQFSGQPLAREITYIIDTSGSMHGISMNQAKQSLLMALDRLRLHDKFNIIQFNSITDQLFSQSKISSFDNILLAKRYVNNLNADGGTEMEPALKLAFNNSRSENYVHQVIFITDGSVGNETALFDVIQNNLGDSRLFTIGIGAAPNSYFMRKAAKFGRGSFTYISDVTEVHQKMTNLFEKLESPLMTDIKIEIDESISTEIWPMKISDLYYGEPVILAIKSNKPIKQIKITGTRALAPWTANLNLNNSKISTGIATFWARKKISALSDSIHEGANKEKVRSDITDIALTHHLVSKYTSLVAFDKTPSRPDKSGLIKQQVPVNLPYGQSSNQNFGRLPQTATSAELNILFGITLLMLALALTILLRNTETSLSKLVDKDVM